MYQRPVARSESVEFLNASGQYIFQITSACPGMNDDGLVSTAEGIAYCGTEGDTPFTADITCQNISGGFHVIFGAGISGGGLNCSQGLSSFIDPVSSVSPELPSDCIITEFVYNDSFDECGRGV